MTIEQLARKLGWCCLFFGADGDIPTIISCGIAKENMVYSLAEDGESDPFGFFFTNLANPERWICLRERAKSVGMVVKTDCNGEGVLVFDPNNSRHLAIVKDNLG